MADDTTGRSDRTRRERRAPSGANRPRRKKPPAGNATTTKPRPNVVPAPTIQAEEETRKPRTLVGDLRSSVERDPTGAAVEVLKHIGPVFAWVIGLLLLFSLSLFAYQYVSGKGDPGMELGWLSPEETAASRQPPGEVRIDGLKFGDPREAVDPQPGEGEPTDGNSGGASGETEAKPVDVGRLLEERDNWELAINAAGGNEKTRQAISRGLSWLSRQQHSDGHWDFDDARNPAFYPDGCGWSVWRTSTGATAMALLAYLGAGHTHTGETLHAKTVEKGLDWLRRRQKTRGPDVGDFFDYEEYGRAPHFFAHSLAVIAICEAYALTGDPELRGPAERGVAYLVNAQHPTNGGWGKQPLSDADRRTGDGSLTASDDRSEAFTWITGWGLMAMFTARAANIDVDGEEFQRTSRFLDSVMVEEGRGYKNRSHPSEIAHRALLAEGLLSRQYLGWERDHPALLNGVAVILEAENRPGWEPGTRDLYAWYHEAEVLHNLGGSDYEQWYAHVQGLIVENQRSGSRTHPKDVSGSWDPVAPASSIEVGDDKLGRLYTTTLCLMILESPFRHMPVYPQ